MTGRDRQPSRPFRLALVFPPALHPTGPPLGLACLAAWVRERLPEIDLRLFDLNLAYHELAHDWMRQGRLRLAFKHATPEETAARVAQALALLTGQAPGFDDPATYQQAAAVYLRWERLINPVFSAQASRIAQMLPPGGGTAPFFAQLLHPLTDWTPHLVGLSALFSQQLPWALGLARRMKQAGAATVLGGATLAVMPEPQRLLSGPLADKMGRGLDWLIAGEGELGLEALARGLSRGDPDPESVPGLIWRAGAGLGINPSQAPDDLAALPLPDFDDFDLAAYHSPSLVLPYLGARGCWWKKCAYCTHRQTYLRYREEPASQTARRLVELSRRHGSLHFSLVDEMVHPKRAVKLSADLTALGADLRWAAYARPEAGFTRELLTAMHAAGCRVLLWGVESGCQRVLDSMGKGTSIETVARVLADAAAAGISNLVFVMAGFPGETAEELEQTLAFLQAQRAHIAALSKSRFLLLPGAPMLDDPGRHGITQVRPGRGDELLGIAFDYEVASGLSQTQADQLYADRLRGLSLGLIPELAILRDHLLIHAAAS
jgi:hypothetical protein